MTTPAEVLAARLWKAWRSEPHIAVHGWDEIPEIMREPFRNMAHAALAWVEEQWPGENETARIILDAFAYERVEWSTRAADKILALLRERLGG